MATQSFKSIIRNSVATIFIRGAFGLSRIAILLLVAKYYGAEEFGLFSLVIAFVEITKVFSDMGVDVVSIKIMASEKENAHKKLESIIGMKIIISSIGIFLVLIVFILLYNNFKGTLLLFVGSISVLTGLLINAFVSYYQSTLSMEKVVNAHFVGILLYFIFSLLCVIAKASTLILIVIIPVTEGITLFLLNRKYSKIKNIHISYSINFTKKFLRESYFVGISGILVALYLRMDNLMISNILDLKSVGYYALAYRIIEPFSLLFNSFAMSLYASLSTLSSKADVKLRIIQAKKTIIPMVGIALFANLIFIFIIRPIIPLFSIEYIESINVLNILGIVLIFKAINTQLTAILNSMEKFRMLMIITITNLFINLILNLILIPIYKISGAALALVCTESINTIFQILVLKKYESQQNIE